MMVSNNDLDSKKAYPMDDIKSAAEAHFERDRFDYDLADSDSDLPDEERHQVSDSDTDSDDSDKETRRSRHKKRSVKQSRKTRSSSPHHLLQPSTKDSSKNSSGSATPSTASTPTDEIEDLVEQLAKLEISSPRYAKLYYKAIKRDSAIQEIFPKPQIGMVRPTSTNRQPPYMPNMPNASTISNTSPTNPTQARSTVLPASPPRPMTCYACGETGHGLRNCPKLEEAISSGTIKRDAAGRILFRDGTLVRRMGNETILQAVQRVTSSTASASFVQVIDSSDESDGEVDYLDQAQVLAAERTKKSTTRHREVMDSVLLPAPRHGRKTADSATRATVSKTPSPRPVNNSVQDVEMTPIDARQPRIVSETSREPLTQVTNQPPTIPAKTPRPKPLPRQSDLSSQINETQVVNTILSTPVTLSMREVLGTSRELSETLTDMIRRKNPKPAAQTNLVESNTTDTCSLAQMSKAPHILLNLTCEGRPVTAIIDTGSQLNIVNRETYKAVIRQPMNTTATLVLNDANGGTSTLRGKVDGVPLACGTIMTYANLYIHDNAPFDLLLGRPWQRENLISIDERKDGTYLIFRSNNNNQTHELLVESFLSPDSNAHYTYQVPEDMNYYSQTCNTHASLHDSISTNAFFAAPALSAINGFDSSDIDLERSPPTAEAIIPLPENSSITESSSDVSPVQNNDSSAAIVIHSETNSSAVIVAEEDELELQPYSESVPTQTDEDDRRPFTYTWRALTTRQNYGPTTGIFYEVLKSIVPCPDVPLKRSIKTTIGIHGLSIPSFNRAQIVREGGTFNQFHPIMRMLTEEDLTYEDIDPRPLVPSDNQIDALATFPQLPLRTEANTPDLLEEALEHLHAAELILFDPDHRNISGPSGISVSDNVHTALVNAVDTHHTLPQSYWRYHYPDLRYCLPEEIDSDQFARLNIPLLRKARAHVVHAIKAIVLYFFTSEMRMAVDRMRYSQPELYHYLYFHCYFFRYVHTARDLRRQGFAIGCSTHPEYYMPWPPNPLVHPADYDFLLHSTVAFAELEMYTLARRIYSFLGAPVNDSPQIRILLKYGALAPKLHNNDNEHNWIEIWSTANPFHKS